MLNKYHHYLYALIDLFCFVILFLFPGKYTYLTVTGLLLISGFVLPAIMIKNETINWDLRVNVRSLIIWSAGFLLISTYNQITSNSKFLDLFNEFYLILLGILLLRMILMRVVRYVYLYGKF